MALAAAALAALAAVTLAMRRLSNSWAESALPGHR